MIVEYVWPDANGNLRSKTKVIYDSLKDVKELPVWNFDGSSTGQATTEESEVLLKPRSAFKDPFRGGDNLMVLCDTFTTEMKPHSTNTRQAAEDLFEKHKDDEIIFGIEQEFFLEKNGEILAWSDGNNLPTKQGNLYCGVGPDNVCGRGCIEEAFKRCLMAGIKITGLNAEVAPSQWEFQICHVGIEAADNLMMMRYVLNRTAEIHGLTVNYDPKPRILMNHPEDNWNGSGCHINFSTKKMRGQDGYTEFMRVIKSLEGHHTETIANYGEGNKERLTGTNETARYDEFTHGVGTRNTSIRIPISVHQAGSGYIEDRRPASNMDPYLATRVLFEHTL